ncbi:MAG: hypothetical protein IH878_18230 [Gemmatimonadetes bacterium]|nr:hypothetical protein [Gemmatimonadota bacterium]
MDFIQQTQELRVIKSEPVAVAGPEAVAADSWFNLEQVNTPKALDSYRYTGWTTYTSEPHDASEADLCHPGLAVSKRVKHNQNRPLGWCERRPETAASEPLKDRAVDSHPVAGAPPVSVDDVLSWLSRRDRKTLADPFHRRAEIAAKKHHH